VIAGANFINGGVYDKWYPFSIYTSLHWFPNAANNTVAWLGYNFPDVQNVRRYKFKVDDPNYGPSAWNLEYSDDGATWYVAHTVTGQLIRNGATYDSGVIASAGEHTRWRIRFTTMGVGSFTQLIVGPMSFWV